MAKEAGLKIGERGGIQVNEHLQTEDPNIYAIGDAIEVTDYINGRPTQIPLDGLRIAKGELWLTILMEYLQGTMVHLELQLQRFLT